MISPRAEHVLTDYLIGFFDVLGQSNKLRQLTQVPRTEAEKEEALKVLKQTAGYVLALRRMFADYFTAAGAPTPFALSLPDSAREQVLRATEAELTCWGISDSIIVAVPLHETGLPTMPVSGVYRAFVAAAGMWLLSLSVDHPLRGGIEVGVGINLDDTEVYGAVLDRAYHLESKVAGGPRIVVGDTCVDYLTYKRANGAGGVWHKVAAGLAEFCLSMLRRDQDGLLVLDPLGHRMLEIARTIGRIGTDSITDRVAPAHVVVRQQLMRAEILHDEKLVPRYRALLAYFDERAPRWT